MKYAYLDTHIAVYLHDGLTEKLTQSAKREIERCELLISPMVLFEFEYLYKRKRIGIPAKQLYETINIDYGVNLCRIAFAKIVDQALGINWTEDPFDRLIVAHAAANREACLITNDQKIREKFPQAVW